MPTIVQVALGLAQIEINVYLREKRGLWGQLGR